MFAKNKRIIDILGIIYSPNKPLRARDETVIIKNKQNEFCLLVSKQFMVGAIG